MEKNTEAEKGAWIKARRRQKTKGNRRWGVEERGKQKGGNSNLPTEITWEKCSSARRRGYDLCQRTSFHATATTGLHYSELEQGRQWKIGVKRKKNRALLLLFLRIIHWGKRPCSCSLPTRSTPLNGTIRRANRFGQLGAFMNKTWPPSHGGDKPLQFHAGRGQDGDCLYALDPLVGLIVHFTHRLSLRDSTQNNRNE